MPVQLFITCIVDNLFPDVGEATVKLLREAGDTVEFAAGQTCCAQPAYNSGYRDEARAVARHFIDVFEHTEGPIVAPSGSCVAMVHHGFADLFANDPAMLAKAHALADRTYELSQYLVRVKGRTDVAAHYPHHVTYHASCHLLRGLKESTTPKTLLDNVDGLERSELVGEDECCGFGGMFSAKMPELSGAMLNRKLDNIRETGAEQVVSCDGGCLLHINGGLKQQGDARRCVHIAEVLASRIRDEVSP